MRVKMVALLAAFSLAGFGVSQAVGQGTGGTVGEGAVGQLAFTLKFDFKAKSRNGINPAVPRDKKRPKVMDIMGGNGDVIIDGKKAGRHHGFDVTTFEGARKYKGGAEAFAFSMVDFGNDNVLWNMCRSSDDERKNPCAVVGGTGRFAGARGSSQDVKLTETKTGLSVDVVVTFVP